MVGAGVQVKSDTSKRKRGTKDDFKVCKKPRLVVILSIYIVHIHPSQLFLFCVKVISCTRKPTKKCLSDSGTIRHQNI